MMGGEKMAIVLIRHYDVLIRKKESKKLSAVSTTNYGKKFYFITLPFDRLGKTEAIKVDFNHFLSLSSRSWSVNRSAFAIVCAIGVSGYGFLECYENRTTVQQTEPP